VKKENTEFTWRNVHLMCPVLEGIKRSWKYDW